MERDHGYGGPCFYLGMELTSLIVMGEVTVRRQSSKSILPVLPDSVLLKVRIVEQRIPSTLHLAVTTLKRYGLRISSS